MKPDQTFKPAETSQEVTAPVHGCRSEFVGVMRVNGAYRLVAIRRIAAGARLFRIEGEKTHGPTRYSVQIDETLHIDLRREHDSEEILDRYFWRFMNHSCDPSARVRDQEVIALRDIEPWAEVTFNYNTTEYDMAEPFPCDCGTPVCLGTVKGFRHLTPAERERLRPWLAPHLSRLLRPTAEPDPR
jgi:hypothetical protein